MLPLPRVGFRVLLLSLAVSLTAPFAPAAMDLSKAPADLKKRIDAGDMNAMFELAQKFEWGEEPMWRNEEMALELYRMAAAKGHATAALYGALILLDGRGVPRDPAKAAELLRPAAEKGNEQTQSILGGLYVPGGMLPRDDDEAFKWLTLAAAKREPSALCRIAQAFRHGHGVKQDRQESMAWMKLAAELGSGDAPHEIVELLRTDPKLEEVPMKDFSDLPQIGEVVKAARSGAPGAAGTVAAKPVAAAKQPRDYSEYGTITSDYVLAYIKKAEAGDLDAEQSVARSFMFGSGGFRRDAHQALAWFRRGADRGDHKGMFVLAEFYSQGVPDAGFPNNPAEALAWYRKAADAGSMLALTSLGSIYSRGNPGLGVQRDDAEGFRWYLRAAEKGNEEGEYFVGRFYLEGRGVTQNSAEAARWLGKSAAKSHPQAKELLARIGSNGTVAPAAPAEHRWAQLTREFDAAFNAATILESRERAVQVYTEKVVQKSGGASRAEISEYILTTLKPYLERHVSEAGPYVMSISSLAYEPADLARLLPAHVHASVKSYAQQTVTNFQQSQTAGQQLAQLEAAARTGGIPQKHAVADRYLREARGFERQRFHYLTKGLYWLLQARNQGDKTRTTHITVLERDLGEMKALFQKEKLGWKSYYVSEYMAEAGYANAAMDAGMILLLGRDDVGRNPTKAREMFQKAVALGDPAAAKWVEFASATAADAAKAEQAFQNGETAAIGTQNQPINWVDARRWYDFAKAHGHTKAEGRLTELTELEAAAHSASQPGFAEFQAGSEAYDKKDYAKALLQWMASAKKGNAEALNALGVLYEDGTGVDADLVTAKKFYESAKAKGLARAAEGLAAVDKTIAQGGLEVETGVRALQKKDYDAARKAWLVAEGKGSAIAKFNLGVLAQNAWGVPRSYTEARNWFAKAQAAGLTQAEQAVKAMDDAIAKGGQEALDGVTAYEAKKFDEALRLLTSAANKGSSYAAFYLGFYHEQGEAGKKDREQAIAWYEKSAAMGHPEGKQAAEEVRNGALGADEFDKGKAAYDAKKYTEAVSWYEKSANLGNVQAMATLGSFLQEGAGEIFGDRAKAKFWLKKAADKGDTMAGIMLESLTSTDYLAAMVPTVNEGPPKGPSLVKGSPWTGDEILAALRKGADHVSLAVALRTDGADLYYGDALALELDPAAASIVKNGRLSNALAGGQKPVAGAWAWDLAKAAIAARKAQITVPARPVDSAELRASAGSGDPAAAYALFRMSTEELKLGNREGVLARNYPDMAKLALEKNYAPALWLAADLVVNQVDKTKNNPVLHAEYLRRSAEAGDAQGAYKYAQEFFAPGDDVAVAPNLAEAELWFIEAGAREQPNDFSIIKPDFALALLYSVKRPIGFQGVDSYAEESTMRWAQELIRRGGPAGEHAKRVIETWRRDKNTNVAAVESLLKNLAPEVPAFPSAEVTRLDTAARAGDAAAAMKLGAAYASGRGVRQHDARAVEYYKLAAAKGSREAMRALARHADKGWGTKKDLFERLAWLEKAGAAGDASAWLEAGDLYHFANVKDGATKDYAKALVAYDKAIAAGELRGHYNLSLMHEFGRGVPKDEAKAMEALRRAADKGHADSMTRLGVKHYQNKEHAAAVPWLEKAVAAGNDNSVSTLAYALKELGETDRAIVAFQKFLEKRTEDFQGFYDLGTLQEKKGDYRAARASYRRVADIRSSYNTFKELGANAAERMDEELNPKPGSIVALRQQAEKGDVEAMVQLVPKLAATDKAGALAWVKKAAAKDHPQALLWLGLETAATDKTAALALIEKSATLGNLEAKFRLGGMKLQGVEIPKDVPAALTLLGEAADAGLPVAQVELGRALIVGMAEIPADPPRGIAYLQKAAGQNVPQAAFLLGEAHEKGVGVAVNPGEALKWYQHALRNGMKEASAAVTRLQKTLGGKPPPPEKK